MRDHMLALTLAGIVLINITAIVLLENQIAAKEQLLHARPAQAQSPPTPQPSPALPVVGTLLLEDKAACPDCFDIRQYLVALNDTMPTAPIMVPEADLAQFRSPRLPALAFNSTITAYPGILQGWEQVGYVLTLTGAYAGTWYVLPTLNAPYLANGSVHGRVTVTYVNMSGCKECYDVTINRKFLADQRIMPYKELFVDASQPAGAAIVKRYNITAAPTIILSSDANEYPNLQPWSTFGTTEPDGSYVLRNLQRLRLTYYDLARGEVMRP